MCNVQLSALEASDLLIAGPPCPPWSSQGRRAGQRDWRALVRSCYQLARVHGSQPWVDRCGHHGLWAPAIKSKSCIVFYSVVAGSSVCPPVCTSVCSAACLSVCLPVCLSVCLSGWLAVCLAVCLSVCLLAALSVPSVCPCHCLPKQTYVCKLLAHVLSKSVLLWMGSVRRFPRCNH